MAEESAACGGCDEGLMWMRSKGSMRTRLTASTKLWTSVALHLRYAERETPNQIIFIFRGRRMSIKILGGLSVGV